MASEVARERSGPFEQNLEPELTGHTHAATFATPYRISKRGGIQSLSIGAAYLIATNFCKA